MSGIYIPGMEMPKTSRACPFTEMNEDWAMRCKIHGTFVWRNDGLCFDCPLVPVPEHGRLVDADALPYTRLYKDNWIKGTGREAPAVWKEDVDSAPTIIPADEEAEE